MATEYERHGASRQPGHDGRGWGLCSSDPRFEDLCRRYREIARLLLEMKVARASCVETDFRMLREERTASEASIDRGLAAGTTGGTRPT